MLVIDPNDCIDCRLCVPECPVDAIFAGEDLPPHQRVFLQLNVDLARHWPEIRCTKLPLPEADSWAKVEGKLGLLDPRAMEEI